MRLKKYIIISITPIHIVAHVWWHYKKPRLVMRNELSNLLVPFFILRAAPVAALLIQFRVLSIFFFYHNSDIVDYKWRKYISRVWIIVGQRDNNNEWHVRFSRISWYIIPRRSVIVIYRDASLMCLQRVFLHFWVFDSRLNNFLSRFLTILVVIFFHIWLAVAMSNLAILFFNCKIFNFTV